MVCVPTNMQQPSSIPNNLERRTAQFAKFAQHSWNFGKPQITPDDHKMRSGLMNVRYICYVVVLYSPGSTLSNIKPTTPPTNGAVLKNMETI